jgi:DNA-binding MarR family transcriptional regulator
MAEQDEEDDETLPDSFWAVARRLRGMTRETLAPWDITPSQLRALRVMSHKGDLRLSALSERLHIAARSATEVVDALESRELVARRPDPDDRRATLVGLTDAGRQLLDAVHSTRRGEEERLFGRLDATDRAHLARILGTLRD